MVNKALFSSESDDWSTPQDIYEALDNEFNFNLDPCSDENNHKCDNYFTKDIDGLKKSWGGTESFAIRRTQILPLGLKRLITRRQKTILSLSC